MSDTVTMSNGKHFKPSHQADSMADLVPILARHFGTERCVIGLTGGLFEEVPFGLLRTNDGASRLYDDQARLVVEPRLIELLTRNLIPLEKSPAKSARWDEAAWRARWRAAGHGSIPSTDQVSPTNETPSSLAIVWARWAAGKLTVSHGVQSVDLPFQGWASFLQLGETVPAPMVCPFSGESSYEIASTDDGDLTVSQQIERCEVSGRLRLRSKLTRCSHSHAWVSPEFLVECPLSEAKLLARYLRRCEVCRELVAPAVWKRGRCYVCDSLQPVSPADSIWQSLPCSKLAAKGMKWRMGKGKRYWVLLGEKLWQRYCIVLDEQGQGVRRQIASRWRGIWRSTVEHSAETL